MGLFMGLFFLIPATLGLAEILHILKRLILKPTKPYSSTTLIFIDGENAPLQLLYAAEQYLWQGKSEGTSVIAVYSSDDELDLNYCQNICKKNGFELCNIEEISGRLNSRRR